MHVRPWFGLHVVVGEGMDTECTTYLDYVTPSTVSAHFIEELGTE